MVNNVNFIKIISCNDSTKWYADKVGELVPLLAEEETEYKSLQDDGAVEGHRFINFVSKEDAVMLDAKEIVSLIKESVQKVTFTKVNGDKRVMTCTLQENMIPPAQKGDAITQKKVREYDDRVVAVWDLKAKGFRSFRVANVVDISIVHSYKDQMASQDNLNWDGE